MANIPEYTSRETPGSQLGGANSAGEIAGGVYEGLASGLHSIGEAVQRHGEQQESSKFASDHSALTAIATNAWEDIKKNQDASDPAVRQKFLEDYGEKVDAFTDNITSSAVRAHAEDAIARTKAHFSVTTLSDQSAAAGAQAVQRINDVQNNGAATAYIDPTYYDGAGNVTSMYVAASGLPQNEVPKATVRINKEIAKSTVDGMLDRGDTANARKDIESGRFDKDLDGTEKAALLRKVVVAEDAYTKAQKDQREEITRQKKDTSEAKQHDYLGALADPTLDPVKWTHAVLTDKDLSDTAIDSLIRMKDAMRAAAHAEKTADHADKEHADAEGDKAAANSILARINAPVGDPNRITDQKEIYDQVKDGGLTVTRANTLVASLNQVKASLLKQDGFAPQYAEFHRAQRAAITHGLVSKEGDYADFMAYVEPLIQKGAARGLTAGQMFDKDSPDYVGKGYKAPALAASSFEDKKPTAKAPAFSRATLDTIPRGTGGSAKGIEALKKSGLSRDAMINEAKLRGWVAP